MITIEDKLDSFKKIINEDILNRSDQEIEQIKAETQDQIQHYKAKKYEDIERLKKDYAQRLQVKKERIHSRTLKEGQDILLNANKEIYEDFFRELKKTLKEKYQNEPGEKYLQKSLDSVKDEIKQDNIIYISSFSYDRDYKIISERLGNVEIAKTENIKIGGFEVEDKDKTYRLNYSIDFLLDQRYTDILTKIKEELNID